MSSRDAPSQTSSAAAGVDFSSVVGSNGESSSRAASKASKSSGKRSSLGQQQEQESRSSKEEPKREIEEAFVDRDGNVGQRNRSSGGFLLDSVFTNGSPRGGKDIHGKRKAYDGSLRVDKRRHGPQRVSAESSLRSSPLSREFSVETSNAGERGEEPSSRTPSMDPAQLVQMALNLSENRKRHVSNTLHVPLPSSRRAVSGPVSNIGTVRSNSAQKRRSQFSDGHDRDTPSPDVVGAESQSVADVVPMDFMQENVFHTFSPATLSRAEKARKYFELASEHRRLLEHLPPLKPDSVAPGNFTYESISSPGSTYPEISRVLSGLNTKHALGREYNPIQSLRNRRIRISEKRPFPAPPDAWSDVDKVKSWIDSVEAATRDPYYRAAQDRALLPKFDGDDDTIAAQNQGNTARHRRTDTVGTVITRPENSWTIEPTELLADAYWTEKDDNKAYIESRHGHAIFPSQPRQSNDTPKISVEMHRGRSDEMGFGNDSDDADDSLRRSRRHKLIRPLKGTTERGKHKRLLSRSGSRSSFSSSEGRVRRTSAAQRELGYENIGPLERHMQELIAKDAKGELSSPEVVSPDHWDSKHLPYQRRSRDQAFREPMTPPNGRASLDVPRESHQRSKSADGRVGSIDHTMSDAEDVGSQPASPAIERLVPSMGMDLSSPQDSSRSLDGQRPRLPLPAKRSRSKERNGIGQVDFAGGAATGGNLSPIMSNDSWRPRTSQESGRPFPFTRHKTNESSSSGLPRVDTSATFSSVRDPGSAVGRIFKGGRDRLGGIVRGDGPKFSDRFRNRDKFDGGPSDGSRQVSDAEDAEDGFKANGSLQKRPTDLPGGSNDVSPRTSLDKTRSRPKYHLSGLPSFTSSGRDKRPQTLRAATGDHLTGQQQAQREPGKPDKPTRAAPPRINLPNAEGSSSTPDLPAFKFPAVQFEEPRKSYGDLSAISPAALAASPLGSSVSRSPGQRHWSIYDQAQPMKSDKVTSRDIARVRALLLCSGIKAREIQRRSNDTRENPSDDLVQAAKTANKPTPTVSMKEQHLAAARLLSTHLNSAFSDFENTLRTFQSQTASELASRLDETQHKASDHLTNLVHETSDEADAFTVELTTRQPQQTKQVDDAIDALIRQRRRQFRLLRRTGFKLLEWLVLCILWGIWFLVFMFNTARKTVVGVFRFLHWLLVF